MYTCAACGAPRCAAGDAVCLASDVLHAANDVLCVASDLLYAADDVLCVASDVLRVASDVLCVASDAVCATILLMYRMMIQQELLWHGLRVRCFHSPPSLPND